MKECHIDNKDTNTYNMRVKEIGRRALINSLDSLNSY